VTRPPHARIAAFGRRRRQRECDARRPRRARASRAGEGGADRPELTCMRPLRLIAILSSSTAPEGSLRRSPHLRRASTASSGERSTTKLSVSRVQPAPIRYRAGRPLGVRCDRRRLPQHSSQRKSRAPGAVRYRRLVCRSPSATTDFTAHDAHIAGATARLPLSSVRIRASSAFGSRRTIS